MRERTNLKAFYMVGLVLAKIQDERLSREGYRFFESYCRDRWGVRSRNEERLISLAKAVSS